MTSTPIQEEPGDTPFAAPAPRSRAVPFVLAGGALALVVAGGALMVHAESKVNKVALAASPKPVTVIAAKEASYRDARTYVGTLRPWIEANVGPQFISAYVDTVLVRPGAAVARNDVLATLDCRNASASSQAVAAEARAIDARQQAVAHESARIQTLLDGGYVSPNEAEQKAAQSTAEQAQLAAQRAKMASTRLEVNDCVLRAPFDGEIATRTIDPGAFVRPGTPIVSVVDRTTVRMTFDVPEEDFGYVSPGAPVSIHVLATDQTLKGTIARRAPSADLDTRTVHVEIDLVDPQRRIPVNTTGEVRIAVGQAVPATRIPLTAATVSGSKATVFVVEGEEARKKTADVLGEQGSDLYVAPSLTPGARIVTEGRATLADGDRVAAKEAAYEGALSSTVPSPAAPAERKP
jgi:RND family efflux transporter MFP subunit